MDGGSVEHDDAVPNGKTESPPERGMDEEEKGEEERESSPPMNSSLSVVDYLNKISGLAKEKKLEYGLNVCNEALSKFPHNPRLLQKKKKVLVQLHRFHDALETVQEWIHHNPQSAVAKAEHERLQMILNAVEENSDDEQYEENESSIAAAGASAPVQSDRAETNEDEDKDKDKTGGQTLKEEGAGRTLVLDAVGKSAFTKLFSKQLSPEHQKNEADSPAMFTCTCCDIQFFQKEELDNHSHSYLHKQRLALDDTQDWQYRAPPRGLASDEYSICKRIAKGYKETGRCTFGDKCTEAHSEGELEEWNKRYAFRKQQLRQSLDARSHGSGTYIEQLMEKLMSQEPPKMLLVENMDQVKVLVNSDLKVSMTTKKCTNAWTFTVTGKLCLHCVALMSDTHRSYFHISSISVGPRKTQKYQNLETQCQEWINQDTLNRGQGDFVYRVKVVFKTDIYGTFRQSMVFDFGVEAILVREVQVESAPATDPERIRREITVSEAHRWNERTVTLVAFSPRPVSHSEKEGALLSKYTLPQPDKFCPSETTVMQSLSKDNYRLWMHEMLYIEELAQVGYISRFNVTTSLQLVNRFLLMPSTLSTAKYAQQGELFARMKLEDDLSEDSMGGRLVLQASHVCWVAEGKKEKPEKVYEVLIEDKGKNFIFMRLSKTCVDELGLTNDQEFTAQIQFQLNRLPMCEMHSAVDRLPTLDIVFPNLKEMPDKLNLGDSILQDEGEKKRLNDKQKDAVRLILAETEQPLPPLLIVGPFGTGKTFTMAQAAKQVLKKEGTRILICTHSNSAADLYIKEFLHAYVGGEAEEQHAEARPLRLMFKFRWIQTVPEVVLGYTLLEREGPFAGTFREPTVADVLAHRIIITTLSSARMVADLDLPKDAFSHIFIDEAAQSFESETLIPLSVAHDKTRIVFAGDHMQMSPEVYSDFTRQQGFHTSLLERLHELYPKECVYKVMLCENYRAHSAIIDFTSELFYDNKLISSGNIVPHDQFYPLTFYAAKGEEIQHENSTGFYNLAEVYEIVERVDELKKKWPESWGAFDNNGISVVAPYSDQVARIRSELRKRKLFNVNVERVLNVQGKQYRVILLSITRTRLTCRSDPNMEEYLDFGFLSNIKVLNTAITRAQSLVVVVGDPVSVCLVGKCRKIWEYFLEICHDNDSLHGISWVPLREQLDRAELTKSFVLNPLAPEFVPNSRIYHHPGPQTDPHGGAIYAAAAAAGSVGPGGLPHQPYLGAGAGWLGGYHPAGIVPGQHLSQLYAPFYHTPMYQPYFPHLQPTMFYPPGFGRGFLPSGGSKQVFGGRFGAPGSATGGGMFPLRQGPAGRDGVPRTVDMPGGRGMRGARGGRNMYYASPRIPMAPIPHGFHPMMQTPHHPGFYYPLPPEDPRSLPAMGSPHHHPHSLHPFLGGPLRAPVAAYGGFPPTHPGAFASPLPPHPGLSQGSPSPQSSSPHQGAMTRDRSDTADSAGSRVTDSPSSGIQLLPNVKHVPAHLLGKPRDVSPDQGSGDGPSLNVRLQREEHAMSSSVSSRPYSPANLIRDRSGSDDMTTLSRSYSPANYLKERPSQAGEDKKGERAGSGSNDRRSYSPAVYPLEDGRSSWEDGSSGHERSMSISPPAVAAQRMTQELNTSSNNNSSSKANGGGTGMNLNNRRQKPNLTLRTGFSRQYSDDLPTPTVITNMIQMIDDNIEEVQEEVSTPEAPTDRAAGKPNLRLKMTVAQRLQYRQEGSEASSSSSTPPSAEDAQPSYASMVSTKTGEQQQQRKGITAEEATQLELQTPRTPKGFITPGADVEVDPFGILKSLNIGGTPQ